METLTALLDEVTGRGIETLTDEQGPLLELADREWRGEMQVEVELEALRVATLSALAA